MFGIFSVKKIPTVLVFYFVILLHAEPYNCDITKLVVVDQCIVFHRGMHSSKVKSQIH